MHLLHSRTNPTLYSPQVKPQTDPNAQATLKACEKVEDLCEETMLKLGVSRLKHGPGLGAYVVLVLQMRNNEGLRTALSIVELKTRCLEQPENLEYRGW